MVFWHCTRDAAFTAKYGNSHLSCKCMPGQKMVCYLQVQEIKMVIILNKKKGFHCGYLWA